MTTTIAKNAEKKNNKKNRICNNNILDTENTRKNVIQT